MQLKVSLFFKSGLVFLKECVECLFWMCTNVNMHNIQLLTATRSYLNDFTVPYRPQ